MSMKLVTKHTASRAVSDLAQSNAMFSISVGEDLCFGLGNWINIGNISLFPSRLDAASGVNDEEPIYNQIRAIEFGGYEWQLPSEDRLVASIRSGLVGASSDIQQSIQKSFLQGLQDVIRRSLLLYPVFDARSTANMPFKRPTTIVPDTSSVHQGALNFVCQFLSPTARIKVPAIVHMEILMQVDNYFSGVRWNTENKSKPSHRPAALRTHLLSQGGQRALLRLEIESDAELERGDLGADPLRGIVIPSSDPEDKALGLSKVSRSFADRLIVETARHFQTQVRPDHPLALLTSDQGMARMALSEGIDILFFQARSAPQIGGRKLTGTLFHPFNNQLYIVPLIDVLWELTVSFGSIRLQNPETDATIELWAIGGEEELSWQTDHVREDMLWLKMEGSFVEQLSHDVDSSESPADGINLVPEDQVLETPSKEQNVSIEQDDDHTATIARSTSATKTALAWYKFSPNNMAKLIGVLAEGKQLTKSEIQSLIGVKTYAETRRYINFLQSGRFINVEGDIVNSDVTINPLWDALINADAPGLFTALLAVPSFQALYRYINKKRNVSFEDDELPVSDFAKNTYVNMGEAAQAWLAISDDSIVITDFVPTATQFADVAFDVYSSLALEKQTEHILTGQWLETLATKYALHPEVIRRSLSEAINQKLLQVYAEGSTPDTRFEKHSTFSLISTGLRPYFERVYLYHGDFLLPGTSSVRIKIERMRYAP